MGRKARYIFATTERGRWTTRGMVVRLVILLIVEKTKWSRQDRENKNKLKNEDECRKS